MARNDGVDGLAEIQRLEKLVSSLGRLRGGHRRAETVFGRWLDDALADDWPSEGEGGQDEIIVEVARDFLDVDVPLGKIHERLKERRRKTKEKRRKRLSAQLN